MVRLRLLALDVFPGRVRASLRGANLNLHSLQVLERVAALRLTSSALVRQRSLVHDRPERIFTRAEAGELAREPRPRLVSLGGELREVAESRDVVLHRRHPSPQTLQLRGDLILELVDLGQLVLPLELLRAQALVGVLRVGNLRLLIRELPLEFLEPALIRDVPLEREVSSRALHGGDDGDAPGVRVVQRPRPRGLEVVDELRQLPLLR